MTYPKHLRKLFVQQWITYGELNIIYPHFPNIFKNKGMANYSLKLFSADLTYQMDGRIHFENDKSGTKATGTFTIIRKPDGEEESVTVSGSTHWLDRESKTNSRYNVTLRGEEKEGDIPYAYLSLMVSFSKVTVEGENQRWGIAGQILMTLGSQESQYLVIGTQVI